MGSVFKVSFLDYLSREKIQIWCLYLILKDEVRLGLNTERFVYNGVFAQYHVFAKTADANISSFCLCQVLNNPYRYKMLSRRQSMMVFSLTYIKPRSKPQSRRARGHL